jgi:hypothetical protein
MPKEKWVGLDAVLARVRAGLLSEGDAAEIIYDDPALREAWLRKIIAEEQKNPIAEQRDPEAKPVPMTSDELLAFLSKKAKRS